MKDEWKLVPVEPTEDMVAAVRRYDAAFEWQGTEEFARGAWLLFLATAPQPPSQWPQPRPMSEAPKDAVVLAWWPRQQQWVVTWWWSQRSVWFCRGYAPPGKPTHYLPMPPAPTEQQEVTK